MRPVRNRCDVDEAQALKAGRRAGDPLLGRRFRIIPESGPPESGRLFTVTANISADEVEVREGYQLRTLPRSLLLHALDAGAIRWVP